MGAIAEQALDPRQRGLGHRIGAIGDKYREEPFVPLRDIGPFKVASTLPCPAFADAEEPAHAAIGRPVSRIDQQRRPVREIEPTADNGADAGRPRGVPGPHDAGDRIAVDDAERGQLHARGRDEQLLRARRTAQEAEMGRDLQLDITGLALAHANAPCRNQRIDPVDGLSPSPARNSQ